MTKGSLFTWVGIFLWILPASALAGVKTKVLFCGAALVAAGMTWMTLPSESTRIFSAVSAGTKSSEIQSENVNALTLAEMRTLQERFSDRMQYVRQFSSEIESADGGEAAVVAFDKNATQRLISALTNAELSRRGVVTQDPERSLFSLQVGVKRVWFLQPVGGNVQLRVEGDFWNLYSSNTFTTQELFSGKPLKVEFNPLVHALDKKGGEFRVELELLLQYNSRTDRLMAKGGKVFIRVCQGVGVNEQDTVPLDGFRTLPLDLKEGAPQKTDHLLLLEP